MENEPFGDAPTPEQAREIEDRIDKKLTDIFTGGDCKSREEFIKKASISGISEEKAGGFLDEMENLMRGFRRK